MSEDNVNNAEFFKTQDPKYVIIGGMICNAFTKEPIPDDEPVFILRAKDIHAYATLDFYANHCLDVDHRKNVEDRMVDFDEFKSDLDNIDRIGEPDTLGHDPEPRASEQSPSVKEDPKEDKAE